MKHHSAAWNRRHDEEVRASALQSVDLSSISFSGDAKSHQNTVFTAFLFGASHEKSRQVDLLVSLGKALNEMSPSLCVRQVAGPEQSTRRDGPV